MCPFEAGSKHGAQHRSPKMADTTAGDDCLAEAMASPKPSTLTHEHDQNGDILLEEQESELPDELLPMQPVYESKQAREGELNQFYQLQKILGKGGFGTVSRAKLRGSSELRAIKAVPRGVSVGNCSAEREISILSKLNHPFIVKLHDAVRDEQNWYLVMDFCEGCTLHQHVKSYWNDSRMPEDMLAKGLPWSMVARYAWQMLTGVAYLHHHRFAHRDIKPDNYMLKSKSKDSGLRLIDFGSATSYISGVPMTDKAGSLYFAAPEVFSSRFTEKCDVWSIGIVIFYTCMGRVPISGKTDSETIRLVKEGKIDLKRNDWRDAPTGLRALVSSMLVVDPCARPSAKSAIACNEWLKRQAATRQGSGAGSCCIIA